MRNEFFRQRVALFVVAVFAGAYNVARLIAPTFSNWDNVVNFKHLFQGLLAIKASTTLSFVLLKNVAMRKGFPIIGSSTGTVGPSDEAVFLLKTLSVSSLLCRYFGLVQLVIISTCFAVLSSVFSTLVTFSSFPGCTFFTTAGALVCSALVSIKHFKRQHVKTFGAELPTIWRYWEFPASKVIANALVHLGTDAAALFAVWVQTTLGFGMLVKLTARLRFPAPTTRFHWDRIIHVGPPNQALLPLGVSSTTRGISHFSTVRMVQNG